MSWMEPRGADIAVGGEYSATRPIAKAGFTWIHNKRIGLQKSSPMDVRAGS